MDRVGTAAEAHSKPLVVVWASWFFGPAVFVFSAELNYLHEGDPDCLLAFVAVAGHGVALLLTAVMAAAPRFRRLPEFWFMLTYWVPLAFLFLALAIRSSDLGRGSLFAVLGWTALVPLAGLIRFARVVWQSAQRA